MELSPMITTFDKIRVGQYFIYCGDGDFQIRSIWKKQMDYERGMTHNCIGYYLYQDNMNISVSSCPGLVYDIDYCIPLLEKDNGELEIVYDIPF